MINLRNLRDAAIVGFALAFVLLIVEIIIGKSPFEFIDRPIYDAMERGSLKPNEEIVLVDLDESSVMALGDTLYWSGFWLPGVIEKLQTAKAVAIALPYFQPTPIPRETQAILAAKKADSLSRWFRLSLPRTRDLLDSLFSGVDWDEEIAGTLKSAGKIYLGFQMLDELHSDRAISFDVRVKQSVEDLLKSTQILNKVDFLAPPDSWIYASEGLGYLDVVYSNDRFVREVPLVAVCKGKIYASLAFSIFRSLEGEKDVDLPQSRALRLGDEEFRLGEGYTYRIHYTSRLEQFIRIPIKALRSGSVPSDTFKGKIVFIGSSFEPYAMSVPTPLDAHMPRMVLEANLLTGLLYRQQAVPPSIVVAFFLTFALAGLGAFLTMLAWRRFALPGFLLLIVLFYIVVQTTVAGSGTRIAFLAPLLASGVAVVVGYFIYYYAEGRRRSYIKQMVRNYFPAEQEKDYIERFMDLPYLKLNRDSVVLAVNLDFEKREKSLQEALKSFEEFRTKVLKICRKHGGLRMSFMGDSALFLFSGEESYLRAAQASLEVRRFFTDFNAKYVTEGIGEFTLGMGLAGGETLVSTLGKVPLVDLAVFGTPVLLARELALLNFELKTKILIEEGLRKHLPPDAKLRELGELEIVGARHTVYEYLR